METKASTRSFRMVSLIFGRVRQARDRHNYSKIIVPMHFNLHEPPEPWPEVTRILARRQRLLTPTEQNE